MPSPEFPHSCFVIRHSSFSLPAAFYLFTFPPRIDTLSPDASLLPHVMKKVIATPDAPAAVGPYSQAIGFGQTLYCSGQIPLVPETGELVAGDVSAQTAQVLKNLGAVLHANGMTHANIVKTTVFLTDLADFAKMNAVYETVFVKPFPARSTIQVVALPKGANVEIEAIATSTAI